MRGQDMSAEIWLTLGDQRGFGRRSQAHYSESLPIYRIQVGKEYLR